MKIGDRVTVVGMIDRQLHRCIVVELTVCPGFRARDDQQAHNDRYFARDYEEEGINWARGWDTPDVQSLHALTVLENCSR